jgi:hypothetical protein
VTTSPSSFVLECGASPFEGPLELTSVSNYTLTGAGCGGSLVTVTSTQSSPVVFSGGINAKSEGMGTLLQLSTTTLAPLRVTSGAWPAAGAAAKNLKPLPPLRGGSGLRDIGVFPSTVGASELVAQFGYGCEAGADLEAYVTADSNQLYILDVLMPGCGALEIRNASDGTQLSFGDITFMFPTCIPPASAFDYPAFIRTDHEAGGRLVVAILWHDYYCISMTDTPDPQGNFTEYVWGPLPAFFNYASAFEFSVWGDYYTSCWLTTLGGEHCVIIDRNSLVNQMNFFGSTMMFFDNTLFNTTDAYAVNPVHQGLSPRGTFLNASAPCGLFAMANGDTQRIEWVACTAIDFLANTSTLVTYTQASSWTSGVQDTGCYPLCIPTFDPLVNLTSFANRLRTAYWDSQLALVWPQANRELLWHEQAGSEVLSQTPIASPVLISSSNSSLFAPGIMLDCHLSMFLEYTEVFSSVDVLNNIYTYRLSTDPADALRAPGVLQYTQVISPYSTWAMPQPYPNGVIPRTAPFSTFFQTAGQQGAFLHLLDQSFNITYTATDACNTTQQCTQEVRLLANTACLS